MSASFYKVLSLTDWARLQAYLIEEAYGFDFPSVVNWYDVVIKRQAVWRRDVVRRYEKLKAAYVKRWKASYLNSRKVCVNVHTGEVYEPVKWVFLTGDIEETFLNKIPL